MNRKLLLFATLSMAIIGVAMLAIPFVGSLRPGARADAMLPRVDISALKPGQVEILEHPVHTMLFHGGYRSAMVLLKRDDGTIAAWDVPINDWRIGMPEIHWWRPRYACVKFGVVVPDGEGISGKVPYLSCLDADTPEWWRDKWRWRLDGTAMDEMIDDLPPLAGVVEGRWFVAGKRALSDNP